MAPDINLLPDEDRRAEARELRSPRDSSNGQPVFSQPNSQPQPAAPTAKVPPVPPLPEAKPTTPPPPQPKSPEVEKKPAKPLGLALKDLLSRFGRPKAVPAEAGVSLDVNLIPQETSRPSYGTLWPLVAAVLGAGLVVAGAFVGLGLGVASQQRALADAQAATAATAERLLGQQQAVEEMSRAVQRVRSAAGLLDGHIYWNQYFTWLESVTLPDVYYTGFMGDVAGTFTLTASARDYVTLAQQLVVLRADPAVQRVSVAEASRDSQGWVNFSMSLTVSPEVFTRRQ